MLSSVKASCHSHVSTAGCRRSLFHEVIHHQGDRAVGLVVHAPPRLGPIRLRGDRHDGQALSADRIGVQVPGHRVDHDGAIDRHAAPHLTVAVGRDHHEGVAARGGRRGGAVDHLGEVLDARERVGHRSGNRDRQAEHAGASGHQASRDGAGPIAEVVGHLADVLACRRRQPPLVVERVRDGGRGYPRRASDVLDTDRPATIHPREHSG